MDTVITDPASQSNKAPTPQSHFGRIYSGSLDLQQIITALGDTVFILDADGRYLDVATSNPALLVAPVADLLGRTFHDFFPTAIADQRVSFIRQVLASRQPYSYEYSVPFGQSVRWFSATITPVAEQAVIWVARDITERRRLESLSEFQKTILELIATGTSLTDVLTALVQYMGLRLAESRCSVLILSPESQHLNHAAAQGLPPEYLQAIDGLVIGPQAGSCGTAAYRREQVIVEDIEADPLWDDYRHLARQFGLRACWSRPILSIAGRVYGTFAIYYQQPRVPQADELELMESAAYLASIAMDRHYAEATLRQAEAAEREKAATLEAVRQASLSLTTNLEFPGVLDDVLQAVFRLMTGAKNVHIFLYDAASDQLSFGSAVRADGRTVRPWVTPRPHGLTHVVARSGQSLVVADMNTHPLYADAPNHWGGAIVGIPLKIARRVVGVMSVAYAKPRSFSEVEIRQLDLMADQAASAIENARLFQAERAAREQAEALSQAAGTLLTPGLEREQALSLILEQLARVVEYDSASIMLIEAGHLSLAAHRGLRGEAQGQIKTLQVQAMEHIGQVISSKQPLIIADTHQDPRWQWMTGPDANYIRCWLGAPLVVKDRVIGVLNLDKRTPGYYTLHHGQLASAFANQAALAIEQSRLYETVAHEAQRLMLITQLSRDLTARLDLEQVYTAIYRATAQLMPAEAFAITLLSESGVEIQLAFLMDKGRRYPAASAPADQGLSATVIQSGRVLRIDNLAGFEKLSPLRFGEPEHARSLLMVPLFLGEKVIGTLSAQSYREYIYGDVDEQTLSSLAYQAAIAIENARLYAKTHDQLRDQKLLHECGQALAVAHDSAMVFRIVAEKIVERFAATSLTYYSYTETTGTSRVDFEYWGERASEREQRSVAGQLSDLQDYPVTRQALQMRWPRSIHRGQAGLTDSERESLVSFEGQSMITVPIVLHDHAIGLFEIWNSQFDYIYSDSDERLLLSLATQTAIALENAQLFAETHRQSLELATLLDAARSISASPNLEEIISIMARKMAETTNAVGCTISRWNRAADCVETWVTWRQRQMGHADAPGAIYHLAEYPTTRAVLEHRLYRLITITDSQADSAEVALMKDARITSLLMLPLIVGDQVIGLVEVFEDSLARKFAADEIALIQGMTNQAAIAIANAQLFDELGQEKRRLELLYELSQNLATSLDPYEVGLRALERMCRAFEAYQGAIYIVEPATERIRLVALSNASPERIEQLDRQMSFRIGQGLTGWVARQRAPVVIDNVLTDPHWVPISDLDETVQSLIAAPLVAGNSLVGVINLSSQRPAAFQLDQIPLLTAAATPVAAALHNAQLFRAARLQAEEIQAATSILHALNASPDVADSFPAIVAGLKQLTNCERVSLALLDETHTLVTIVALDHARPDLNRGTKSPVAITSAATDVLAGRPHLTPNLETEVAYPAEKSLYDAGYRSRINVPLRVGTQVIGALNLVWRVEAGYHNLNLASINQIADALALAIEKNRFFEESRRRDALLELLAYSSQRLLLPGNLRDNVMDAMAGLGQVVKVSRAHVFENHLADDGGLATSQLYEWCAEGVEPQLANAALQNITYSAAGLQRWLEVLGAGNPLYGLVREMPLAEQELLTPQNIRALAVMPIFSGGTWWGFLAFDDCLSERQWTVAEIETLKNAAAALGAAFARQESESSEREQRALAEALRDTASALNSTLNVEEVLDRILENVGRVVPHDAASILMIDQRRQETYIVRRAGFRANKEYDVMAARLPLTAAPNLRQMLAEHRPIIISDTRRYPGWVVMPETRWVRSYLGTPIVIRGMAIGFLNLDSLTPNFFTPRHSENLQAFANEAAIAIQNAQLFAAAERHAQNATLLNDITQAALAATDYAANLPLLARKLGQLLPADGCYITLWDQAQGRPIPATPYGLQSDNFPADAPPRLPADTALTTAIVQAGRPLICDDVQQADDPDLDFLNAYPDFRSGALLGLPLMIGEMRLGAVIITFNAPHRFTAEEVATSEQAAGQVALSIFKGKLLEAEREQRVLAESFRDTAEALNSTLNFNEVLDHILANVGRVVPHDSASIMLAEDPSKAIDPIHGVVRIVRARGFAERKLESWVLGVRFRVSESGKIRRMLEHHQPVVLDDTHADPEWFTFPETSWIRSHLAAPIGLRGWIIGFINLDSAVPRFFTELHAERLRVFADQAAVAIENAYLYDSIRQNAEELSFLYRASAELIRPGMPLAALADHISAITGREFQTAHCEVWLLDESLTGLRRISDVSHNQDLIYDALPLYGPSVIAAVARSSQPIYVAAVGEGDLPYKALYPETHSTLTAPLTGGGRLMGVLHLESPLLEAFDVRARRIISAFAERAGLALENTQLVVRLDLARRSAEEASQLKSEFLANTSHELRTPLTGIIGSLSMVLDEMCDSEAEQREFIKIAYAASEHLLDIINKVLDIAKIESGRLEVDLQPWLLAPLLGELYGVLKVQADDKRLRLDMHLPEDQTLKVLVEPEKLRQIMFNLIGNAIKFTERGSVGVSVHAVDDDWVQVAVRDTGVGIPLEKQAKLFQPFVQVDGSTTRKYGGTGLGLSISRELAEVMGGSLTLQSEGVNRGTTLTLRLQRVLDAPRLAVGRLARTDV